MLWIMTMLGAFSVAWTAYEIGRLSRGRERVRAWGRDGRRMKVEICDYDDAPIGRPPVHTRVGIERGPAPPSYAIDA